MPIIDSRSDVHTYYEATCDECEWLGQRKTHNADAWLDYQGHIRSHHPDAVREAKYRRTVTYELVEDEVATTSESETGESTDASR